ncbi:MAG: DNA cytosine methyltransferase [Candidatus Anammoxibacter sp.]
MRVLDLFSGIGGFTLGLERAGMQTVAFCEKGRIQRQVLRRHWPEMRIYEDATKTTEIAEGIGSIDVIAGGDPCPIRSRARSNGASKHPDLSGYYLALVGQLRPRWVVRENVPAPDDKDFTTALEMLGYRTAIVRTDAASVTGQSRQRDFVIGAGKKAWHSFDDVVANFKGGSGGYTTRFGTRQIIPALTTHRMRYDSRDCYIWEGGNRLRILDGEERETFAGFPTGWLAGLSETAYAAVCGNAVVPEVVAMIGRPIMAAEETNNN